MSNYKVKVNNEAESREAQGLFEQLGGKHHNTNLGRIGLVVLANNIIYIDSLNHDSYYADTYKCKELTIPQLRDLVVLKRNSIDDATHEDYQRNVWFVSGNDKYMMQDSVWELRGDALLLLKPLTYLKEYLVPQDNGKYALTKATEKRVSDWVEVPEGAEAATFCKNEGVNYWKENGLKWFSKVNKEWCIYSDMEEHIKNHDHKIVWTRHTQPEELPFVDDEPKLNTPMAEAERGFKREQCLSNAKNKGFLEARDVEPVVVDLSDIKKTFSSEPKSLNDTYAEIEQIRQDSINNPQHYNKGGVECIDAIEASMTPEAFKGYLKGNVQKYMWRYEHKGGKESLQKAQWYLNKLISKL